MDSSRVAENSTENTKNDQSPDETDYISQIRDTQLVHRKFVNKAAYAKLQRSLSPPKINTNLEVLKEKYETSEETNQSDVERPKLKRSAAIKLNNTDSQILRRKSKLPVFRHRNDVKSELISSTILTPKRKDENANEVSRKNSSSSVEFISIVTRSESEGSVDKLANELNMFTMEKKPKEKKRSNSFRRIFTGRIFSKDKRKKEENVADNDNVENESNSNSFSRQSPHRHTTGGLRGDSKQGFDVREIEQQYAQMHVKEFNDKKHNFERQRGEHKEKPVNNPGPIDHSIRKFVDSTPSSESPKHLTSDSNRFERFGESLRDTPPRAEELKQDGRMERLFPNKHPKHNQFNFVDDSKVGRAYLDETYGTVLDSLEQKRSPSLDATKLRMPSNREIAQLSPRMKSPIPQHHVSAERIIATELLKSSRSPTPTWRRGSGLSPSHQKLEIGIDYPENTAKPPMMPSLAQERKRSLSSAALPTQNMSSLPSMSTRSSTPVDSHSPQKEDMKRSVEAYYWKEIKKLKDQENQELYFYQMQYAEASAGVRRGRSASPASRTSRRSLSLPREPIPANHSENYSYAPIPEGRAVMHPSGAVYYQQNLRRSAPERRTVGGSIYRPIFKRGSLTTPVKEILEDPQKKVSFNSSRDSSRAWPTKNGYTQSPPQRRIEVNRNSCLEDDVFLPSSSHVVEKEIYANRPISRQEEIYGYHPRGVEAVYAQRPPMRRQIILNDDIYGSFGEYYHHPSMYASRHVSVSDKVCDIYGQIHDKGNSPHSGVILGQLQGSPGVMRHPPPFHYQDNFVRNCRLTASANDMYRRYQNVDARCAGDVGYRQYVGQGDEGAPCRPLPPVPKVIGRQSVEGKRRGLFGEQQNFDKSVLELIDEETKHMSTTDLERLVLSEKLKLLRTEKILEDPTLDTPRRNSLLEKRLFPNEPGSTESLQITELRRLVLLEELQIIRMKLDRSIGKLRKSANKEYF